MPKHLRLSVLAAIAGASFCTAAQAQTGPYLGLSVGNAQVGIDNTDIEGINVDIQDNDIGYKVFGGFKFLIGGLEAGYIDFGSIQGSNADVEIKGFDAFGVLSMGIGPVEVFGKLGGFVWESDITSVEDSYSESGFDPAAGLGASFSLGGLGVRAEYEYFDIAEFDKISMLSIGVTFSLF